jgi:hypothetical protein
MTNDQLRQALRELNGERNAVFVFAGINDAISEGITGKYTASMLTVKRAMLVPDEEDHLAKVTDGKSIYIIDAERVAWIQIG